MAGLIGDLLSNTRALAAHTKGVEIAGKNLANINNPNYARQRVVLSDRGTIDTPIGPQSMGLEASGIQQIRDQFLDVQVTREASQTGSLLAQQTNLLKAQADLGEQVNSAANSSSIDDPSHSTNGISSALNDFFNAFDNVASRPTDAGAKQVLLQKAETLTNKFNVTDGRLSALQSDITGQINGDVSKVNGLLKDIASLNGEIQSFEIGQGNPAVDLRDQRQGKLEELSQYMDFTAQASAGANGQLQILTHDGAGAPVVLVDRANVMGGISFDGTQFSGGAPATPIALQGGSLKGDLLVRDGAIQQLRDDVKATAQQLVASVNKAYNPTGATGDFFKSTAPTSGIIALDPTLSLGSLKTTDSGNSGANELALAVASVASQTHATSSGDLLNGTLGAFFSQTVSGLGESVASVDSNLSDQQTIESMIRNQRDSVSGVSQDEELTDLMKYQRAFQASARVVNVIDNLLDVVVNGLIR